MIYLVNELLCYSNDCPDLIQILHELVTVIWESEDIPDQWRRATIRALHKKGNLAIPSNFCPLSLISTLSRTVTKLCRKRINAGYRHVLDDCQYGFKQHVGTVDAICCFKQLIKNKDEGIHCLFLDLRGAFNLLCRSQLHEIVKIMLGTTKIANIKFYALFIKTQQQQSNLVQSHSNLVPEFNRVLTKVQICSVCFCNMYFRWLRRKSRHQFQTQV